MRMVASYAASARLSTQTTQKSAQSQSTRLLLRDLAVQGNHITCQSSHTPSHVTHTTGLWGNVQPRVYWAVSPGMQAPVVCDASQDPAKISAIIH
eukprot:scaffold611605_cov17-Prasinocladus_malaysianus.AAC.1